MRLCVFVHMCVCVCLLQFPRCLNTRVLLVLAGCGRRCLSGEAEDVFEQLYCFAPHW